MRDFLESKGTEQEIQDINNDRVIELRTSKIPVNLADFEEPFNELDGYVDDYLHPIITEPEEDPGDFPNNIVEVYWGYYDSGDEYDWYAADTWKLFCRLDNGNYAYLDVLMDGSDYMGMGPENLKLYVSKSYEDIIKYAMSDNDYESYIEDTEPLIDKQADNDTGSAYGIKGIVIEEVMIIRN
jgi:hypothetical protein